MKVTCWNCKQKGHYRRDCTKPPAEMTSNQATLREGDSITDSGSGKRAVAEFPNSATETSDAPISVFKAGTLDKTGDGLVVEGCINERRCRITIDTGSNISIVRPDVLGDRLTHILQLGQSYLKTVTGERAPI